MRNEVRSRKYREILYDVEVGMDLKEAPGSPDLQRAAQNQDVQAVVHALLLLHEQDNECFNNYCFVERQSGYRSRQVDVAVLSHSRKEIEGYTCKMRPHNLLPDDCINLTKLSGRAKNSGYTPYTGVICFDNRRKIEQKLEDCSQDSSIYAYGLDNFDTLAMSPATRYRDNPR